MKLRISAITATSAARPPGYVQAVMERGTVQGGWLEISPEALAELRGIYRQPHQAPPLPGLGDLIASIATPIARALHLPCIDPATQQLRPESGCAKRKAWLNHFSQSEGKTPL